MASRGIKRKASRRPLDLRTIAEGLAGPENDTRMWASYGIVDAGDEESPVVFDEEDGQPYVYVTLEPSKQACTCRVGMEVAGNGEGDWTPFVTGDEVLVVFPAGREDSGVIIKRLCNKLDAFPMSSVAGQDPTKNNFGFQRRRTPYINEYAGPIYFRSATTGALFSIDTAGTVTIKDAQNAVLQMSPDVFCYQGPSTAEKQPEFVLQLSITNRQYMLKVGDAYMQLSASDGNPEVNTITVPGAFSVGTVGNAAQEHVATTEAVVNMLACFGATVAAFVAAAGNPAQVDAALAAVVAAAASNGTYAAMTASTAAVQAGFAVAVPKTAGLPGKGQMLPGLGCPGFLAG